MQLFTCKLVLQGLDHVMRALHVPMVQATVAMAPLALSLVHVTIRCHTGIVTATCCLLSAGRLKAGNAA